MSGFPVEKWNARSFFVKAQELASCNPWPVSELPPTFNEAVKMYQQEFRFCYITTKLTTPSLFDSLAKDLDQSHLYTAVCAWWTPPLEFEDDFDWFCKVPEIYTQGLAWEHPKAFYTATLDLFQIHRLPLGADYAQLETRESWALAKELFRNKQL
jgi:hypothetical protein